MAALQCAHCHKPISVSKVTGTRGKGFSAQIQCYHCQAWLGRHGMLTILKVIGFYTAVIAGVTGYFVEGLANIITPVIMLSLILTGVTHLMDHLLVIEAPEEDGKPTDEIK
ncbi:hypothetical protein BCU84_05785 [Shewanella sp. 10N.286.51.B7]|uniref:hypothetical protein n=1 Tax=Shewanella sp. 10N.286.51.B7 TaxID=1880836 RepID=UPI000C855CDD|nr:hypothetical protein [Shewanella sp. 10N.286.51.B7]PMG79399.1 hypothetical protein BCU84_05785 [Shewanella sp. 10N.286.51.B7]